MLPTTPSTRLSCVLQFPHKEGLSWKLAPKFQSIPMCDGSHYAHCRPPTWFLAVPSNHSHTMVESLNPPQSPLRPTPTNLTPESRSHKSFPKGASLTSKRNNPAAAFYCAPPELWMNISELENQTAVPSVPQEKKTSPRGISGRRITATKRARTPRISLERHGDVQREKERTELKWK